MKFLVFKNIGFRFIRHCKVLITVLFKFWIKLANVNLNTGQRWQHSGKALDYFSYDRGFESSRFLVPGENKLKTHIFELEIIALRFRTFEIDHVNAA